jgi:hypothetical protein
MIAGDLPTSPESHIPEMSQLLEPCPLANAQERPSLDDIRQEFQKYQEYQNYQKYVPEVNPSMVLENIRILS